jgi:carboxyl-terminal processing protease
MSIVGCSVQISPSFRCLLPLLAATIAACGGGGAATPAPTPTPTPPAIPYTVGVFQPSASFASQCQIPRTGTDPSTGRAYPDRQATTATENHWLRSWTNELYLWFNEVTDRDPSATTTTSAFFDLQKTTVPLASGQTKDRFHFTANTAEYRAFTSTGASVEYGIDWKSVSTRPARKYLVRFVEPGSPAAAAGITRGAELLTVDGIDFVNDATTAGVNTINAALFPTAAGQAHSFSFRTRAGANQTVSLTSATITVNPVPIVRTMPSAQGIVGYLLFNTHSINSAEADLMTAIDTLKAGNVQDLILDLRYNGGGYLDMASELAYMIAGPVNTAGKTFELTQFNSKHPATDPVTGRPIAPLGFHSTTQGFVGSSGRPLPTLNLPRVYVLTSSSTCSASESVINGLIGAGVVVYQFGADTCGKPYGFYPQDNCGTTYFSIQFRGVNALGFGDYVEGFTATRTNGNPQAKLPGCIAGDDLSRDLGDPAEDQLRTAVVYRNGGGCTAITPAEAGSDRVRAASATDSEGTAIRIPSEFWRENRLLRQ